jgi:hypothetical protein
MKKEIEERLSAALWIIVDRARRCRICDGIDDDAHMNLPHCFEDYDLVESFMEEMRGYELVPRVDPGATDEQ